MYVLNMVVFQSSFFYTIAQCYNAFDLIQSVNFSESLGFGPFILLLWECFFPETPCLIAQVDVVPPVNDQVLLVPENTWRRLPARGHAHYSQWVALLERTHRLKSNFHFSYNIVNRILNIKYQILNIKY